MKKLILLSILLSFPCLAYQQNWEAIRRSSDHSLWRSKENKKSYTAISKKIQRAKAPIDLNDLIIQRKKMLSYSGISHWKLDQTDRFKYPEATELLFKGSYVDNKGQLTSFIEIHRYDGKEITQILMTSPVDFQYSPELKKELFNLHD